MEQIYGTYIWNRNGSIWEYMEQNVRFEKIRFETSELYLNIHLNIHHKLYTEKENAYMRICAPSLARQPRTRHATVCQTRCPRISRTMHTPCVDKDVMGIIHGGFDDRRHRCRVPSTKHSQTYWLLSAQSTSGHANTDRRNAQTEIMCVRNIWNQKPQGA